MILNLNEAFFQSFETFLLKIQIFFLTLSSADREELEACSQSSDR